MIQRMILAGWLLVLAGCNWVDLKPGAEKIMLAKDSAVGLCEKRGSTTTSVLDRVGLVERDPGKVEDELAMLARNGALDLAGDTIVPLGKVVDGRRKFGVYRCRK